MNSNLLRAHLHFLIIALLLLTTGCFHCSKKNLIPDSETQEVIAAIQNSNTGLRTFKGIGSVKLANEDQKSSFRLAWAGENPDKLRLVVLMSGRPIETFAEDGESLYLKSHTGAHNFIEKKSKNNNLEKLISISVKTEEIISLLSGKIPLAEYKCARLIKAPDNKNYILELSRPWWGVVERIFLNNEKEPSGFEMVNCGDSVYSVLLNNFKNINGFSLPFEIFIKSETATCKIIYTNYFTNPEVDPATFVLFPN